LQTHSSFQWTKHFCKKSIYCDTFNFGSRNPTFNGQSISALNGYDTRKITRTRRNPTFNGQSISALS